MRKITCPLCGGLDYKLFLKAKNIRGQHTQKTLRIVKCESCGFIFLNPQPNWNELSSFYNERYYLYLPGYLERLLLSITGAFQIREFINNTKRGRILDIGCGNGEFLARIKKLENEVWGIDVSGEACILARKKKGIRILNKELEDCQFPSNFFDTITMWHVLEHLPNPFIKLREIHRILKKDGILVIEVPNIACLEARIFAENWFALDVPRHLCHFSTKTLKVLLKKAEFVPFKISHFTLAFPLSLFTNFSNTLKYRLKINHAIFRSMILFVFLPFLLMGTILLRLIDLFGLGEVIRIYSRKRG